MKRHTSIRKRLLLQHLLIVTVTVVLLEAVFFISIYQYYYKNTEDVLISHAKNSANFATKFMDLSPFTLHNTIPKIMNEFQMPNAEMQIVSPAGNILASSTGFSQSESIHREILQSATSAEPAIWTGKNMATDERVMASVVPLKYDEETTMYFRYVVSLSNIDKVVKKQGAIALLIGLAIILVVMLLSRTLAKQITTPLTQITEASKQFAKGDFEKGIKEDYIGELGILAHSFNNMAQELLQHEKMKNQFLSTISHELRTPLTSIKGWSETLLSGDLKDVKETETGLQIITKETARLIKLVEELLDFSRINNDSLKIQPSSFLLLPLFEEVKKQFEKQLKKRSLEFTLELPATFKLYADRNRVKQVFINLIDNAIKYGGNSSILLNGKINGHLLTITVMDHGPGIEEKYLSKLTTPFYKVHENSSGTGLGLAISRRIVEAHHGQFSIESKVGNWTKVTIIFPLT
ncbi:sensor histidine kinase [Lederbergia galactosidilytica]|nr:HAMP domain-containing sensor histidine kinase [Lederbergia galactosidilytica]MBP1916194.1 signal transduction histidine kinase [Lederbergia galactosidilytica]